MEADLVQDAEASVDDAALNAKVRPPCIHPYLCAGSTAGFVNASVAVRLRAVPRPGGWNWSWQTTPNQQHSVSHHDAFEVHELVNSKFPEFASEATVFATPEWNPWITFHKIVDGDRACLELLRGQSKGMTAVR